MKGGTIPGHAVHVRKRTINHDTLKNQAITLNYFQNWRNIAVQLKALCVFYFDVVI